MITCKTCQRILAAKDAARTITKTSKYNIYLKASITIVEYENRRYCGAKSDGPVSMKYCPTCGTKISEIGKEK